MCPQRGGESRRLNPGSAGLPRLREGMSFLDGADREREKISDGFHHRLEFSLLDVGLVLRAERGPLPFFVYVVIKLGREGDRQTCHRKVGPTFLKGVLNRLGESFSLNVNVRDRTSRS